MNVDESGGAVPAGKGRKTRRLVFRSGSATRMDTAGERGKSGAEQADGKRGCPHSGKGNSVSQRESKRIMERRLGAWAFPFPMRFDRENPQPSQEVGMRLAKRKAG